MPLRREPRRRRPASDLVPEPGFERLRELDVHQGSAGDANQVVVVARQTLSELVASEVVVNTDCLDDSAVLEDSEVAVHGASRKTPTLSQDLGHRHWAAGCGQQGDERPS